MQKWYLLKWFQELGEGEMEESSRRGKLKYIWYIVRTSIDATMYPHPEQ
jgi:hypothetical protein